MPDFHGIHVVEDNTADLGASDINPVPFLLALTPPNPRIAAAAAPGSVVANVHGAAYGVDPEWTGDSRLVLANSTADGWQLVVAHGAAFVPGNKVTGTLRADGAPFHLDLSIPVAAQPPALSAPFLLEGWESTEGVTLSNVATMEVDPAHKVQGTGALRLRPTGTAGYADKALGATFTREQVQNYAYFTYVRKPNLGITYSEMGLKVGTTPYFPNTTTGAAQVAYTPQWGGGFWNYIDLADTTMAAGAIIGGVRARLNGSGTHVADYNIDAVTANAKGRPTIVLTFDDSWLEHYTIVAPMLEARGFRGTFYVSRDVVLSGNIQRLTLRQCLELHARGHDIAINCPGDVPLTAGIYGNPAAAAAAIGADRRWFIAQGMARAADHMCYSNGAAQIAPPAAINVAVVTGNGTKTISFGAAATGLAVGMNFYSPLLQIDAMIEAVAPDNLSVTLSEIVPAGTGRGKFVDESGPYFAGKLQAALASVGMKTARLAGQGGRPNAQTFYSRFGFGGNGLFMPGRGFTGQGVTQMTAWVDGAIKYGETGVSYMHRPTASGGSTNVRISDLAGMLDYMEVQRNAGLLDVLTISELWSRDGASVPPL